MDIKVVQTDHNQITGLHQRRHAARRRHAPPRSMFDAKGSLTATSLWNARSDASARPARSCSIPARAGDRPDRGRDVRLRQDRRAGRDARPRPGRGAGAARPDRGRDVARAVRPHHRRHRGRRSARRPASTSISGRCSPATRINLTYTDTPAGTQRTVTIVRVDDPSVLPLPRRRTPNASDKVVGRRFLRRHGVGRSRRSTARSARPDCSSPIRPAPRCACSTTAPAARSTSMRCRPPPR